MYQLLNDISQALSQPFYGMIYDSNQLPIITAFILGLVGALAPCQLTGNITAITFYGNKSLQTKNQWIDASFFIFGKLVVFTSLGLCVWIVGQEFQEAIISFFSLARKFIGLVIVIIGIFLLGFFRLSWINKVTSKIPQINKEGKTGAFLMGVTFSIAFCPTMFILFFVTLMPLVLTKKLGFILPSIFGIGTAFPLIIFLIIIWFFGINGALLKRGRKFGIFIQRLSGILIIFIGVLDIITYW